MSTLFCFSHLVDAYSRVPAEDIPDYCPTGIEVGRAKVPLIFFNVVELKLPNHVLRQFGRWQKVPMDPPIEVMEAYHSLKAEGKYCNYDWVNHHQEAIAMWDTSHTS